MYRESRLGLSSIWAKQKTFGQNLTFGIRTSIFMTIMISADLMFMNRSKWWNKSREACISIHESDVQGCEYLEAPYWTHAPCYVIGTFPVQVRDDADIHHASVRNRILEEDRIKREAEYTEALIAPITKMLCETSISEETYVSSEQPAMQAIKNGSQNAAGPQGSVSNEAHSCKDKKLGVSSQVRKTIESAKQIADIYGMCICLVCSPKLSQLILSPWLLWSVVVVFSAVSCLAFLLPKRFQMSVRTCTCKFKALCELYGLYNNFRCQTLRSRKFIRREVSQFLIHLHRQATSLHRNRSDARHY